MADTPIAIEIDFSKVLDYGEKGVKLLDRAIQLITIDVRSNMLSEAQTFKRPTGRLTTGINRPQKLSWATWGIYIRDKYWKYVEGGRGPVYPVKAKALHFFIDGKEIFVKSAGPAKANPFITRAIRTAKSNAAKMVRVAAEEIFG